MTGVHQSFHLTTNLRRPAPQVGAGKAGRSAAIKYDKTK